MAYGIQLIDGITQQNGGSFFLVRSKDVEYNGSGQSLDDAVKSGLFKGEKGDKGDSGEPFRITKTFETIGAMNAAFGTTDEGVTTGQFVVIATDNPDSDEDNGKLYVRTDKGYTYIVDLSGLKGIQGPKGDTGDAGAAGAKGDKGDAGESAFATWQAQEGNADKTEADFLASLKGDKGDKGDPGAQGPKGDKGDPGDAASVTPATTDEITALFTAAGA